MHAAATGKIIIIVATIFDEEWRAHIFCARLSRPRRDVVGDTGYYKADVFRPRRRCARLSRQARTRPHTWEHKKGGAPFRQGSGRSCPLRRPAREVTPLECQHRAPPQHPPRRLLLRLHSAGRQSVRSRRRLSNFCRRSFAERSASPRTWHCPPGFWRDSRSGSATAPCGQLGHPWKQRPVQQHDHRCCTGTSAPARIEPGPLPVCASAMRAWTARRGRRPQPQLARSRTPWQIFPSPPCSSASPRRSAEESRGRL